VLYSDREYKNNLSPSCLLTTVENEGQ